MCRRIARGDVCSHERIALVFETFRDAAIHYMDAIRAGQVISILLILYLSVRLEIGTQLLHTCSSCGQGVYMCSSTTVLLAFSARSPRLAATGGVTLPEDLTGEPLP